MTGSHKQHEAGDGDESGGGTGHVCEEALWGPWSFPSLMHGAVISSTCTGATLQFQWGSWLGCFEMIAFPVERQTTHIDNKQRCSRRQNTEATRFTVQTGCANNQEEAQEFGIFLE